MHRNGKIVSNCEHNDHTKVHRLPILVSSKDLTKLLAVPKQQLEKAYVETEIVILELRKSSTVNSSPGMCFDSTSVNAV